MPLPRGGNRIIGNGVVAGQEGEARTTRGVGETVRKGGSSDGNQGTKRKSNARPG